ncbi:outer membrane protein assembly factor BamE [Microvirga brassicacearum]|uniref:Outer membrane protein assembly factor BamE n=1 Tax=Microvirga brassicacearum TaxID=2580413 RepID=A0A5N3P8S6_9HYPH|nr:outer membrane protein assembly factor BamE [Microvirga brassicacearum]KAB0266075.1 outer membrane protein assembly factor BamE [Microvirga brassicacearum]
MRRYKSLFVRLAAATFLASSVAGCMGGETFQRGYIVDERAIGEVKKGMSGEQVLTTLGTPSTVSTVGNKSWYYISQKSSRRFQFMPESVIDQRVTAVYFDNNLRVERVALYGIQDGKVFDFISRTTPSGGQESSFIGQLFRGASSFNPFGA